MPYQIRVRIDGYETTGMFGHWEPFKHAKEFTHTLSLEETELIKTEGELTIDDIPFKGAWTDVECDWEDVLNGVAVYGDAYATNND